VVGKESVFVIEFRGYISGAAEKHFHNKARNFGQYILIASVLVFLPSIIHFSLQTKNWLLLSLYCTLFLIIPLSAYIPQSRQKRASITPKRIYTEEDTIVCVADKYVEYRLLSDVKQVRDFGEFYEIVFPFGKISEKYICQKDLLTIGTIEDFEKMFDGKIVRRYSVRDKGTTQ